MKRYDPDQVIDPEEWTALDEAERHHLVESYHRKRRIKMPSLRAHAAIHVTVENQIALGGAIPVKSIVERLMSEGLNRHEAIHAVGYILAGHMFNMIKHGPKGQDVNAEYYRQLEELTAERWRNGLDPESDEEEPNSE